MVADTVANRVGRLRVTDMSPYRSLTSYAANNPVAPVYAPRGFQLADFIRIVDARRGLILRVMGGVVLCALIVALALPTLYSSAATVLLDPRKNNITDLSAVISPLTADPAAVQNQIQIITSRDLAARVVDRLKLTGDPEFNPRHRPAGAWRHSRRP